VALKDEGCDSERPTVGCSVAVWQGAGIVIGRSLVRIPVRPSSCRNPGQVVPTYVPLSSSTSSIIWYRPNRCEGNGSRPMWDRVCSSLPAQGHGNGDDYRPDGCRALRKRC